MGCTEDDIHRVRTIFDDFRHGIEHGFDALVRRQKPKRKNDGLSRKTEFCLCTVRLTKRQVGILCGMISTLLAGTSCPERSNCRPFSDMTTTFAEISMMRCITSCWTGVGLASTV